MRHLPDEGAQRYHLADTERLEQLDHRGGELPPSKVWLLTEHNDEVAPLSLEFNPVGSRVGPGHMAGPAFDHRDDGSALREIEVLVATDLGDQTPAVIAPHQIFDCAGGRVGSISPPGERHQRARVSEFRHVVPTDRHRLRLGRSRGQAPCSPSLLSTARSKAATASLKASTASRLERPVIGRLVTLQHLGGSDGDGVCRFHDLTVGGDGVVGRCDLGHRSGPVGRLVVAPW